jgi:hypothetical protein
MNYNDGSQYGFDQYYSDPAYLENPIATTEELIKRNAKIAQKERQHHSHKIKTLEEQQIDDMVQQELRNKIRYHIENYFNNQNNEVDYPNAVKNRKVEGFGCDGDDQEYSPFKSLKLSGVDTQFMMIILVIILFVLSVFQYAQAQSLRETIYNLMLQKSAPIVSSQMITPSSADL